ncbi:(R)-mandelonitrile lyase [Limisalsivibrio acetivorans]|uniref:(R)-mandelonitrile lyase n=1 Tax=Limisalsivibrio acetivorans TaxID=1304888 RepID=UPI0003B4B931|nr:cupin domain-containing protein [Limisalsivibrio acetivorans]
MKITKRGTQGSLHGPREYFTGEVRIDPLFLEAEEPSRATGALVTFKPGARTAWHAHPAGQSLIITSGEGRAQSAGGDIRTIQAGDVVWFPAGEKHWHGASPDAEMSHIAIQEKIEDSSVEWMEHVTDNQYHGNEVNNENT